MVPRDWIAALALVAAAGAAPAARAGTAELTLRARSTTSAGIYDDEDRLVRTLWSGQARDAGTLRVDWDGRDDDGRRVTAARRFTARVIAHNVRYVWEGVIGNTSAERTGASIHRALEPINDMAFDAAGNGFYAVGYNEGQPALHRFHSTDPQRQTPMLREDYRRVFRYVATDGELVYFANVGLVAPRGAFNREPQTFVAAARVDGGAHRFAAGVDADAATEKKWPSVIDLDRDDQDSNGQFRSAPTGLAVQRSGKRLFVAHGRRGEIRVFDKTTGERVGVVAARGALDLDVGPDDSLWALQRAEGQAGGRTVVVQYRESTDGWREATRIERGLDDAVAIGVSPRDGTVVVVDAGSEQLKAFDARGRSAWTLGRAGGYRAGGPAVTNDKFAFSAGPTYVTFLRDGSFWVGDPGNVRNLHYAANRSFVEEILYLPRSYVVSADSRDPTRVFRHFLEFRVDYAAPLASSWKLVANWGFGLDRSYRGNFDGFQAVHTLENGRTYGVVRRYDLGRNAIVELADTGLRATGTQLDLGTKLYADGAQRMASVRFEQLNVNERPLAGFDGAGNPRWSAPRRLAEVANLEPNDPYYHDVPLVGGVNEATYPVTGSGVIVSFNPSRTEGFHLGGLRAGTRGWLWRASPSGSWNVDERGRILEKDGRYEIGNRVQYPGNIVGAAGRNIVFGYHGEAWRGGQANQWLHFYDNGLFVGQFGRAYVPGRGAGEPAPAEAAGNAFSHQLVTAGGETYLWHNDESAHGGVHRWRIDGADRIELLEAPIDR